MKNERGNVLYLEDWMFDLTNAQGKRLTDTSLHLFALIYGFSKHRAGHYFGSIEYATERLRASRSSIKAAFIALSEAGLIEEVGEYKQGQHKTRKWIATENPSGSKSDPDKTPQNTTDQNDGNADVLASDLFTGQSSESIPALPQAVCEGTEEKAPENVLVQGQDLTVRGLESDHQDTRLPQATDQNPAPKSKDRANNPIPTNLPTVHVEDEGEDDDIDESIDKLMAMSLNPSASKTEVTQAFRGAIAEGFVCAEIPKGYETYATRYSAEYPTPRYAMRLDKFLSAANGLEFYRKPPKKECFTRTVAPENRERRFMSAHPEYSDMHAKLQGLFIKRAYIAIGKPQGDKSQAELDADIATLKDRMAEYRDAHGYEEVMQSA